jgi:hypothetical protein
MLISDLKEANRKRRVKMAERLYLAVTKTNPDMKVMCVMMAVGRKMNCSWFTVRRLLVDK